MFFRFLSAAFLLINLVPSIGWAETFNVSNGTEFQNALTMAQDNDQADTIILAPGNYDASVGTFTYIADATMGSEENFPLTIQGTDTASTLLDGGNAQQVLSFNTTGLSDDSNADVTLLNLTIQNGNAVGTFGGGLSVLTNNADITVDESTFLSNASDLYSGGADLSAGISNGSGNVTMSNSLFIGNTSANEIGGAELFARGGSILSVNNIFFNNHALNGVAGALLPQFVGNLSMDRTITLVNNTIFDNTSTSNGGGIWVYTAGAMDEVNIYNNIVYGNTSTGGIGQDIFISNVGTAVFNIFNSDFIEICFASTGACDPNAVADLNQGANLNSDPMFVNSVNGDFNLSAGSPAIDTGDSNAPDLPATDFAGNPRIIGPAPDMGALEALPDITVIPVELNFGGFSPGYDTSLPLLIVNEGAGLLEISSLTLSDTVNYSLDPNIGDNPCGTLAPFSLAGGESCTVGVVFTPEILGDLPATLTVNSNDPDETEVVVSIAGNGNSFDLSGGGCVFHTGNRAAQGNFIAFALGLLLLFSISLCKRVRN